MFPPLFLLLLALSLAACSGGSSPETAYMDLGPVELPTPGDHDRPRPAPGR